MKRLGGVACLAMLLLGCQPSPEKASVIAQPKTPVVKNLTSFTESLRCMDDMFLAYGKHDVVITSDGLPDETGKIKAGTKEMLISSISKMTAKSKAVQFVDIETRGNAVFWIQEQWIGHNRVSAPSYYLRGAITQADQGVMSDKQSVGAAAPFLSLGLSRDQMVSLISMDMNLGDVITRQIMPGYSSTNTIAVVRGQESADAQGLIQKASLTFNITSDRAEGSNQAVRTLIELGAIEVLGKLMRVPYWRCLGIDSTNPEMMSLARDWYDEMNETDRLRLVQGALGRLGIYAGGGGDSITPPLQVAIDRYKREHDLIPNGRIDFDLYYSLLGSGLVPRKDDRPATASSRPNQGATTTAREGNFNVGLSLRPNATAYRAGDKLTLTVGVQQAADLYCYYQGANGQVARLFPNRFHGSAAVSGGERIVIPDQGTFDLVLDKANAQEKFACIATQKKYPAGQPAVAEEPDLSPLAVHWIDDAVQQHLDLDQEETAVQFLTVSVK